MRALLVGFLMMCVMGLTGWGFFFASSNGGAPSTVSGTPTPTPPPGPGIFNCTSGVGTSTALSLVLTVNPSQGLVVMHKGSVSNVDPGVSDTLNSNGWISVKNSPDGCVYTDFVPVTVGSGSDTVTVASPGTGLFNAATFCTFNNLASLDVVSGQPYQTGVTTALTGNVTPSVITDTLLGLHYVEANGAATNPVFSASSSNTTAAPNSPTDFALLGTPNNAALLVGATYEVGQQGTTVGFQRPFTVTGGAGVGNFCGGVTALSSVSIAVLSMAVSPTTVTLNTGQMQQEVATATLSNGTVETVTNAAIWSTDNSAVATVNTTGLVTASASTTGTANITALYGGQSATAAVTVSSGGTQTANANCLQTPGNQWAGSGCTVAFTVPSAPTLNAPVQTFQAGVQHTYGSTTCTPAGNASTDDSACLQAAVNTGDVDIKPFVNGTAAIYQINNEVVVPSNRNIRCETNANPQSGLVAFRAPGDQNFSFFGYFGGVTGGSIYGCQFRGPFFNVDPAIWSSHFEQGIRLGDDNTASSGQQILVNDFNGIGGQIGPLTLNQNPNNGAAPTNITIEWNTFENCGTNDVEIVGGTGDILEHNTSSDCSGYVEDFAAFPDNQHVVKWNLWKFDKGTGWCNTAGEVGAVCNWATASGAAHSGADYSSSQFSFNAVTGTGSARGGGANQQGFIEENGPGATHPSKYFNNQCGPNCTINAPPGFNFQANCTDGSVCSNQ